MREWGEGAREWGKKWSESEGTESWERGELKEWRERGSKRVGEREREREWERNGVREW